MILDSEFFHTLQISWKIAFSSAVLTVLSSILFAWLFHPYLNRFAKTLLQFGMMMPSLVLIQTVLWILKGSEYKYGVLSVIFAICFVNTPYFIAIFADRFQRLNPELYQQARSLGASSFQAFKDIYLKLFVYWGVQVFFQVFIMALTSFSVVLVLGGGAPVQNLEMQVYTSLRLLGGDEGLQKAFTYCLIQVGLMLGMYGALYLIFLRKLKNPPIQEWMMGHSMQEQSKNARFSFLTKVISGGSVLLFVLPYFMSFSLKSIKELSIGLSPEILLSFQIALSVAALLSGIVFLIYYFQILSKLFLLLGFFSPLVISFFVWRLLYALHWELRLALMGVICVQVLLWIPYGLRMLEGLPNWRRSVEVFQSQTLGANRWRSFRDLEWPLVKGVFYKIFILTFGFSFGEVSVVSLFLGSEQESQTFALKLLRAQSRYQFNEAEGGLLLLLLVVLGLNILVYLLTNSKTHKQVELL